MNYGSAITQKANFPFTSTLAQSVVHKWSEGQAESRTLAQGQLKLSNYHDSMQIFQYGSEDPMMQLPMVRWIVRMVHASFIVLPSFSFASFCSF